MPGPVNGPGFGATMRRTSGESALGDSRGEVGHQLAVPIEPARRVRGRRVRRSRRPRRRRPRRPEAAACHPLPGSIDAQGRLGSAPGRIDRVEQLDRRVEPCEHLEAPERGVDQLELARTGLAASASAGATHSEATVSPESCRYAWPGGAGATKNQVS